MQTVSLISATDLRNAVTGSSVSYRPVVSYTGLAVIELKRTSATAGTTTTGTTIAIQGSLDGVDWVNIHTTTVATLTAPTGVNDYSAVDGYRSEAKVIMAMPLMRVVTSGVINNTDNVLRLTVLLANG
jgi:hypothetical protein